MLLDFINKISISPPPRSLPVKYHSLPDTFDLATAMWMLYCSIIKPRIGARTTRLTRLLSVALKPHPRQQPDP